MLKFAKMLIFQPQSYAIVVSNMIDSGNQKVVVAEGIGPIHFKS